MLVLRAVLRSLALSSLLGALSGCADRGPTAPGGAPRPFFPLAVGNSWTYLDSLTTASGTTVRTVTVSVASLRFEQGVLWYALDHSFNPSIAASEFTAQNDSVFSLQLADAPGGPAPIRSLEYIPPPSTDTSFYHSLFDGDALVRKSATRLDGTHTVPAGKFTGCATYAYRIPPERYREVLMPGVGMLSLEIAADSSLFGPAWRFRRELVSYRLGGLPMP